MVDSEISTDKQVKEPSDTYSFHTSSLAKIIVAGTGALAAAAAVGWCIKSSISHNSSPGSVLGTPVEPKNGLTVSIEPSGKIFDFPSDLVETSERGDSLFLWDTSLANFFFSKPSPIYVRSSPSLTEPPCSLDVTQKPTQTILAISSSPNQQTDDILSTPESLPPPRKGSIQWTVSPEPTEKASYLAFDASAFSNFFPPSKHWDIPVGNIFPPEGLKEATTQPVSGPIREGGVMTPKLVKNPEEGVCYSNASQTSQILPEEEICFLKDDPFLISENHSLLWGYVKYVTVGILSFLSIYLLTKIRRRSSDISASKDVPKTGVVIVSSFSHETPTTLIDTEPKTDAPVTLLQHPKSTNPSETAKPSGSQVPVEQDSASATSQRVPPVGTHVADQWEKQLTALHRLVKERGDIQFSVHVEEEPLSLKISDLIVALQEQERVALSELELTDACFIPNEEVVLKAQNVFVIRIAEWPLIVLDPNSYMDFVTTVESWIETLDTDFTDTRMRKSDQSSGSQTPREGNSSNSEEGEQKTNSKSRSSGSESWSRVDSESSSSGEKGWFDTDAEALSHSIARLPVSIIPLPEDEDLLEVRKGG